MYIQYKAEWKIWEPQRRIWDQEEAVFFEHACPYKLNAWVGGPVCVHIQLHIQPHKDLGTKRLPQRMFMIFSFTFFVSPGLIKLRTWLQHGCFSSIISSLFILGNASVLNPAGSWGYPALTPCLETSQCFTTELWEILHILQYATTMLHHAGQLTSHLVTDWFHFPLFSLSAELIWLHTS